MDIKESEYVQPFCGSSSREDRLKALHWTNATSCGLEQQERAGERFVREIPREMLAFSGFSAKLDYCRLQSTLHVLANGPRMTLRSESLSQPKMVLRWDVLKKEEELPK
jgi:hypothetical protein